MLKRLAADKEFLRLLLKLALPLVIQQWIQASLGFVDLLMVGQLGDVSVAAVGLGNQFFFLLHLVTFGIGSGTAIFTAQFWGKRDLVNIRKTLGFSLSLSFAASSIFSLLAIFSPYWILGLYTNDPAVVQAGAGFLRILGFCFIFSSCSFSIISVLRSMEKIRLPIMVTIGALTLNTILGYILIFGHFGLPRMGIRGAALGTAIAFTMEFLMLVFFANILKTPLAGKLKEFFTFDWAMFGKFIRTTTPVVLNEFLWALAMNVYAGIYARIGTEAITAVNISTSIEQMGYVTFIGLANACAIMVGNRIGAGKADKAFEYAERFIVISFTSSLILGLLIFLISPALLNLYAISDNAHFYARNILRIFSFTIWARVLNIEFIVGILRSGGDTRFSFLADVLTIWLVGIPLALIGAFVLFLPVYWVYLLVFTEEFLKMLILSRRFVTKRWMNDMTQPVAI